EQQRRFGTLLASWNEAGGREGLLLVENVVAEVVAPLTKEHPVLLLVLDGMSAPVFHEILEDFAAREWFPIARESQPAVRPVLAALPSVTNISRQALFSGRLDASDRRGEPVAFREHPALAGVAVRGKPQLFLKGDLASPGQSFLNEAVREAIASPSPQVVAVLLNVVDDQLSAADQLEVQWRIETIRFLGPILEAAAQAGRFIVLTSDHGHIPDLNQTVKTVENPDGGDRYRNAGEKPAGAGELLLSGERIRAATGKEATIVACEETVRYAGKKAGYHGGASDLEVVIPLAVLAGRNDADESPLAAPGWWQWQDCLGERSDARPAPRRSKSKAPVLDELPLFAAAAAQPGPETVRSPAWLKGFLASAVFKQQAELMGRLAPREEQVTAFVTALEKRGNAVLLATLAPDLGIPPFRLRGLLSSMERLFNVDGYPVIAEDQETVRLDRKLLAKQFEIPV
ncbi:MAG TPA: BREX-2 system phosphatase PglZ, partial [Chthoniobacterales bacterium]